MARYSRRFVLAAGAAAGLAAASAGAAAGLAAANTSTVWASGQNPRHFGIGDTAYVDVAVANLWVDADSAREVDAPSTANPVDIRAWTSAMSLAQRHWLIGNLETAVRYGTDVMVTGESGDWVKVIVPGQPTPRDDRGFPGWLPRAQLTASAPADLDGPFAQVSTPTSWLYDDDGLTTKFMEVSYGTRLPALATAADFVRVSTPTDGEKWVSASDVAVFASHDDIPVPSGTELAHGAQQFLDLPYLWAGTSGFGFDCSGLTHAVYQAHGVTIPRDSEPQQDTGKPVAEADLQAADLLFYGKDRVHHVGMYIGDGDMIDARSNTDTTEQLIEIVKVTQHPYAEEFAGAVRYLNG